jgi:hypothetical protein
MTRHITGNQSVFERAARLASRTVAIGLGGLAFTAATAAPASAHSERAPKPPQPALSAPLVINPAAILKNRLVHHQQVTFDVSQGVNWGPGEAEQTTVPLTADVDGTIDYFSVTQMNTTHGSLRTLRVGELNGLKPDALVDEVFSQLHDPSATPSESGVVSTFTQGDIPSVNVTYSDGEHLLVPVGQSVPNPYPPQS